MYDRLFNALSVLSVLGVVFIITTIPYVFDYQDTSETTHGLNVDVRQGVKVMANNIALPDPAPAFEAKANKEAAKARLDELGSIFEVIDSIEPETITLKYAGEFYLTMYAATVEQCGNTLGITASGRKVTTDPTCHTVAVDPSVIPLGTYLIIEGYEGIIFRADDTGSAINGYDIDIFTDSESESKSFNNVSGAKVWIIQD